jgi:preprotein translocase subunit SecE
VWPIRRQAMINFELVGLLVIFVVIAIAVIKSQ